MRKKTVWKLMRDKEKEASDRGRIGQTRDRNRERERENERGREREKCS